MSVHTNILAGVGYPPRFGALSQSSVLNRLQTALRCKTEAWYFLGYKYQMLDPTLVPLLSAISKPVRFEHDEPLLGETVNGLVLSLLPPNRISEEDWSFVKQFYERQTDQKLPLLIGQKLDCPATTSSPIWQDEDFSRQGTFGIGTFFFHALKRV